MGIKKNVYLVLLLTLLIHSSAYAVAEPNGIIYQEDFQNASQGPYAGELSQGNDACSAQIVERTDRPGDNAVLVTDGSDTHTYGIKINIPSLNGIFTVEFDFFQYSTAKSGTNFYIYDDGVGFPPAQSAHLSQSGGVSAITAKENKTSDMKFSTGKWVRISSIVNPKAGTYSVYIDGQKALSDIAFRNEMATKMTSIIITGATASPPSIFMVDNIRIFTEIEGMENEASLTLEEKIMDAVVLLVDCSVARKGNEYIDIDPENKDIKPFIVNERTLLPVRFISEAFGADVLWEENAQRITIILKDKTVEMVLGSDMIKVGDAWQKIDVAAATYNDRTFVPLRAMAEAIGKKLLWDERGLIIISDTENILTEQDEVLKEYLVMKLTSKAK